MATGVPADEVQDADAEIFEFTKAALEMKPILVYFNKPKDLLAFGNKAAKDPEVDACEEFDKDLWKRWVVTELSKEYVCVRVNTRKADSKLMRSHRVARAPVVMILDFNLKPIYFSPSPRLRYTTLSKVMDRSRERVEAEVKKLAKSNEESDLVKRAKVRAQVIEQRETYDKGLEALEKQDWRNAEAAFNKGIELEQDSDWKAKCKTGLIEIKAGQALEEVDKLVKYRRYKEAKEALVKILADYKEAKYFAAIAKEQLEHVTKKLN